MKEINNFLNKEKFKILTNQIFNIYFPWYLQKGVNYKNDGYFQFTHIFVDNEKINSDFISILNPVIEKINPKKLTWVKLNLINKTEKIIEHGFHTDVDKNINCTTAILYINNNDGYTKFKDGNIIKSEENKFVSFDSNKEHTGSSCTNTEYRVVLNLNYF
jgi:hypothetical protein